MNNSPSFNDKSSKQLLKAIENNDVDKALSILETSSIPKNLSYTTVNGGSAPVLWFAAYQGQANVVEKLLDLGFDLHEKRVLKMIFKKLPFSTFKKAVEAGASISSIERFETDLTNTMSYPDFEEKMIFAIESGLDQSKILASAINNNNQKLVVFLVKNGVDLRKEVEDDEGLKLTPLIRAIINDNAEVVEMLLMAGVKPTSYDLNTATKLGNADIVKYLLKAGAEPTEKTIKKASTDEIRKILQEKYLNLQARGGRRKRYSRTKKGKRHGKKTRKGSK